MKVFIFTETVFLPTFSSRIPEYNFIFHFFHTTGYDDLLLPLMLKTETRSIQSRSFPKDYFPVINLSSGVTAFGNIRCILIIIIIIIVLIIITDDDHDDHDIRVK